MLVHVSVDRRRSLFDNMAIASGAIRTSASRTISSFRHIIVQARLSTCNSGRQTSFHRHISEIQPTNLVPIRAYHLTSRVHKKEASEASSIVSSAGDEITPVANIPASGDKAAADHAKAAVESKSPETLSKPAEEFMVERLTGENTGIVVIGLNRPARKNAIGAQMLEQFEKVLVELKADKNVRVLIIRSHVDGIFCAGADLKERLAMQEKDVGPYVQRQRHAMRAFFGLPFPTIAAVDGAAFGGGFELILAADIRVASETAQMGLLETRLAIIPGAGGTQYLRRLVNPSIAKEMMFTARVVSGQEAFRMGIVNYLVEEKRAYEKAFEIAKQILANGPIAVRSVKLAVDKGNDAPNLDDSLQVEEFCYDNVIGTKDRIEGLTAFMEKRKPKYTGT